MEREHNDSRPGGTSDNSPALQRRGEWKIEMRPVGTPERSHGTLEETAFRNAKIYAPPREREY